MRARLEELFYNPGVTPEDLWRAVGEILLVRRNRLNWSPSDVEKHGGPSYHTVDKIESGQVGRIRELTKHCDALQLSVVDVLWSALDASKSQLNPEASEIVRHFARTTVKGRQALLTVAQALPDADVEEHPTERLRPPSPPAKAPRKR